MRALVVIVLTLLGTVGHARAEAPYGLRNAARSGVARQSSLGYGGTPERAIDGNTNGEWTANTTTHTYPQVAPWLEIDLRSAQPISAIKFYTRLNCCPERNIGMIVELSLDRCDVPTRRIVQTRILGTTSEPMMMLEYPDEPVAQYACFRHDPARGTNYISAAEVEILVPLKPTDSLVPAFFGTARQSSTGYGGVASRAIDGVTDGNWFRKVRPFNISVSSVTSTSNDTVGGPNDSAPWLEIDLKAPRAVGEVVVYNRTDCCADRLSGARVELSLDRCDDPWRRVTAEEWLPLTNIRPSGGTRPDGLANMTADVPTRVSLPFIDAPFARYVCVRHSHTKFLSVAEVQVYPGRARENLARAATADQSTTDLAGVAARAIDGSEEGTFEAGSVTLTAATDRAPWLELDLHEAKEIANVIVHNRTDDCALRHDGSPSPDKGCNARLAGTWVELSDHACSDPAYAPLARQQIEHLQVAWYLGVPLSKRTSLAFPAGTRARYVCLRNTRPLSVAEVQVFGTAFAATPPSVAELAAPIAVAPLVAPAPATSGDAQVVTFDATLGGVKSYHCTATRGATAGRYTLACGGMPVLETSGYWRSSSDFRLASVDKFGFMALQGQWFPAQAAQALALIADVLGVTQVSLVASSAHGLSIGGKLDLGKLGGSPNALAKALHQSNTFLAKYVPGYQTNPEFDVIAGVVNGSAQLAMKLHVITTCLGPTTVAALGAGLKFTQGSLVARFAVSTQGVAVAAGLEGAAYLRPTSADPWLQFSPAFELGASNDSASVKLAGQISGACAGTCAETCSCTPTDCSGAWHPFGLSKVSLSNGYVAIGISQSATPAPIVTLAFDRASVGAVTGKYAASLDYPAKRAAFRLTANRLPLVAALGVFGAGGVDLPDDLAVHEPVLSFATHETKVFNTTIPAGVHVAGRLDMPAIGVRARVAAAFETTSLIDPQKLFTSGFAVNQPKGSIKIGFDIERLVDKIMTIPVLGNLMRSAIERSFWISGIELGAGLGSGRATLSGTVNFRVLGQSDSISIDASLPLRPDLLAKSIATKLASLVGGPLLEAYNQVSTAITSAVNAAAAQMAKGGTVVINGVATAASKVYKTAADAANEAKKAAEQVLNFLRSLCSFCP